MLDSALNSNPNALQNRLHKTIILSMTTLGAEFERTLWLSVHQNQCTPFQPPTRKFTDLEEEVDGSRVVEAGRKNHQQVVQQHGSEVQVELNGFVVQLNVGHLSTHKAHISHPWTQV